MTEKTTLRVFSVLAIRAAVDRLLPLWQQQYPDITLDIAWGPTVVIEKNIAAGQRADAVIVTVDALDRLIAAGEVRAASRIELVDSQIGLAALPGAPHPDISSVAALKEALLKARSVGYSLAGASGIYFQQLLANLGIADEVNRRATTIPEGFTARLLVEGQADIAVQQISELLTVEGIEIIGPLPPGAEKTLSFSAGVFREAEQPEDAALLLAFLRSAEARRIFEASGLSWRE
ncbi:molybdate ABC transporter substrate-binding protein [Pantoea coffeiphila]|uniref:Molybdate ABC transporter substrate-binding protein n=1 Tax=Pantoea coffeiphila TaxID=1465635 RepID=A0A2S9IEK0_9GAMM|nr:substrate-binding domain-containing protein [Pantoea coffeiphila]PRD16223.1 molybdate ABC transporter substrate-binding protein [Pantoea coffeiphila]